MKKDIDLLSGFNEAKGKKSSSNSSIIMVLGVLIILGVMIFMLVSAKMEGQKIQEEMDSIQHQLDDNSGNSGAGDLEQAINDYEKLATEILGRLNSGVIEATNANEVTSKLFDIIYTDYLYKFHDGIDGENINVKIKIDAISISEDSISLNCSAKRWIDAWDFVEYLAGTPNDLPASIEGGYDKTAYNKDTYIKDTAKNKLIFSGVQENYPGLPTDGDGKEYTVSFPLSFKVNWGVLA